MAPGLTRRRGISRTILPSHWVNLNGGTSVATSIAGSEANTSCRKRIQVLRMPVSPSGRRTRCGPTASDTVRKTVSASGSGMLPTRCTIGCVRSALMVSSPCRRLPLACDCSATFLLIFPRTDEEHHCGRGARKQLPLGLIAPFELSKQSKLIIGQLRHQEAPVVSTKGSTPQYGPRLLRCGIFSPLYDHLVCRPSE